MRFGNTPLWNLQRGRSPPAKDRNLVRIRSQLCCRTGDGRNGWFVQKTSGTDNGSTHTYWSPCIRYSGLRREQKELVKHPGSGTSVYWPRGPLMLPFWSHLTPYEIGGVCRGLLHTFMILCLDSDVLVCRDSILESRVFQGFLCICQTQVISVNSTINPELRVAYKTKAEFVEVCRKHRSSAGLRLNLAWRLLFLCMKAKLMILKKKPYKSAKKNSSSEQ